MGREAHVRRCGGLKVKFTRSAACLKGKRVCQIFIVVFEAADIFKF